MNSWLYNIDLDCTIVSLTLHFHSQFAGIRKLEPQNKEENDREEKVKARKEIEKKKKGREYMRGETDGRMYPGCDRLDVFAHEST